MGTNTKNSSKLPECKKKAFFCIFWCHSAKKFQVAANRTILILQCLQSSLAQDGGAIHWQHCITDLLKTFKTLIKMSQELPALFEIVLRPIWWAAGCEQPSPPLHPAAVAGLLTRSQRCCCCSCSASGFLCSKHTIFPIFFANHISDGQSI